MGAKKQPDVLDAVFWPRGNFPNLSVLLQTWLPRHSPSKGSVYIPWAPLAGRRGGQLSFTRASLGSNSQRMKLFLGILLGSLVLGVSSQRWLNFLREAGQGTRDMMRAYSDMREANYKNSDKYFHARGNYDAAKRGPGGAWAAKVI
ncbi:LOW QUALITY PROTEIN: serum amyloid A-2 protein-like, partial [Eumetopias jubatus]|uniref:LOW QUALITY PROTEIN: serum amyloid A-2 protein-like n=1 Tax=Eumetopias jubatus TaxID=34886 RepID=UPI001015E07F